jgi:hypothetical protein
VRILIVRQPVGTIDGIPLAPYREGESYDLPSTLASYLVAQGFAVFEDLQSENPGRPAEPTRARRR